MLFNVLAKTLPHEIQLNRDGQLHLSFVAPTHTRRNICIHTDIRTRVYLCVCVSMHHINITALNLSNGSNEEKDDDDDDD